MLDHHAETRRIYHAQHLRVAADAVAMDRFIGMFSPDYFGLSDDWFHGRRILDVGCGSTGKLLIALSRMGAVVNGIDVGHEYVQACEASLRRHGVTNNYALHSGSATDLPWPRPAFDFVACHGVLLHLANFAEVEKAVSELVRVANPGGYVYVTAAIDGGLIEDAIIDPVRAYYKSNATFRQFIDGVQPAQLHGAIDFIGAALRKRGEAIDLNAVKPLIDEDLCVYFQNVCQAPTRLKLSRAFLLSLLEKNGLTEIRPLKRYIERKNVRKFLAPLHYECEHPMSKVLFGTGSIEYIARKPETG